VVTIAAVFAIRMLAIATGRRSFRLGSDERAPG